MKKTTILTLVFSAAFLFCGCIGMSNATTNNSGAAVPPSSNAGTTASTLQNLAGSLLGNLLGSTLSAESIVGTWQYSGPDCVFESENLLMKAGGEVAAASLEAKITPYLEKVGIRSGQLKYTFNTDGTYVMTIGNRNISGQYTLDTKNKTVTMYYLNGLAQSTAHVSLMTGKLSFLYEADKLLTMVKSISALAGNNATISTLTTLLDAYNGLLIGLEMKK